MSKVIARNRPPTKSRKTTSAALDTAIEALLGGGLYYNQWRGELERGGHKWTPGLKNIIIRREYEFFKEEILRLMKEENISKVSRKKSNSLVNILKRLQGEVWVKGVPDEWEKRLRERRLLSKDAKARCLQDYAKDWGLESSSSVSQASSSATTDDAATVDDQLPPAVPSSFTPDSIPSGYGPAVAHASAHRAVSDPDIQRTTQGPQDNDTHSCGYPSNPYGASPNQGYDAMSSGNPGGHYPKFDSFSDPQKNAVGAANYFPSVNRSAYAVAPLLNGEATFHSTQSGDERLTPWQPELTPKDYYEQRQNHNHGEHARWEGHTVAEDAFNPSHSQSPWPEVNGLSDLSTHAPLDANEFVNSEGITATAEAHMFVAEKIPHGMGLSVAELQSLFQGTSTSPTSPSLEQPVTSSPTVHSWNKTEMPPQYLASSNSDNGRSAHELYEDSDANMDIDVETSPIEAAEVRETQEACGCRSLGQDAANSQPSNAAKPTQKPRRNQCNRCRFTNRLIKELKVCKEELQKSRGEAECFMKEKTVAEAAVESLIQKNETADAEIRVLRERLQKYLLQEAQDAKLKRQKLLSRTCAPDMSHSDIESERERIAKPFRRFAASKTPLPLHTVAASNGNSTGQVSRPTSGESGTTVSVENSPRRGGNRSGSVDILGTSNAENIREPSPMRRLMRRVSDGLLRKPHEKDSTVPPVPTLPISTSPAVLASTSVSPQLSEVHKTQEKRLTKDSGLGESIRTSIESAQPDTEPMEGLDSHFNVGSNEDTCMGMG